MTAQWAFAAALAGLPGISGRPLANLLTTHGSPMAAWEFLRSGGGPQLTWVIEARAVSVEAIEAVHADAGIAVLVTGDDRYPARLAADHQAPPVLFVKGQPEHAGVTPAVAVIGTRRCTHAGREVAAELGRDLAAAGVCVVSGLALGIDGAAHEGALSAGGCPPVGVVGSGLDVVYPARHRSLWERVGAAGALLSEVPLGVRPAPWRFPMRNRVIAALADAVVVVESNATGGSMHTVAAACARSVPVLAVPGPVRSPASAGANALLADGCPPARDATDVLVALGLNSASSARDPSTMTADEPMEGVDGEVLRAVDWAPTTVDSVVLRTGLQPAKVAAALGRLEMAGHIYGDRGWWERQKAPVRRLHS